MSMVLLNKDAIKATYTYTGTDPVLKGYSDSGLSKRNAFAAELIRLMNTNSSLLPSGKKISELSSFAKAQKWDIAITLDKKTNRLDSHIPSALYSSLIAYMPHAIQAYYNITQMKPIAVACLTYYNYLYTLQRTGNASIWSNGETRVVSSNQLLIYHPTSTILDDEVTVCNDDTTLQPSASTIQDTLVDIFCLELTDLKGKIDSYDPQSNNRSFTMKQTVQRFCTDGDDTTDLSTSVFSIW